MCGFMKLRYMELSVTYITTLLIVYSEILLYNQFVELYLKVKELVVWVAVEQRKPKPSLWMSLLI
jgi:hypothetical protein